MKECYLVNKVVSIIYFQKKHHKAPSPGHGPHSGVARMRLRGLSNAGRPPSTTLSQTLNKNMCLPPVGHTFVGPQIAEIDASSGATSSYSVAVDTLAQTAAAASETESPLLAVAADAAALSITSAETSIISKSESAASQAEVKVIEGGRNDGADSSIAASGAITAAVDIASDVPPPLIPHPPLVGSSLRRGLLRLNGLLETPHNYTAASTRRHDAVSVLETLQEARALTQPQHSSGTGDESGKIPGKRKVSEKWDPGCSTSHAIGADPYKCSPLSSRKDFVLDSFLRAGSTTRRTEFAIEGLSSGEARTMSSVLRQTSVEKIGSSHIGSIVNSASKSRFGNYCSIQENGRIATPESRLMVSKKCIKLFMDEILFYMCL